MANGDDDLQEEDEAVRCICGFDDYPGPPPVDPTSKHGPNVSSETDPIFATDLTDDAAGFFVQCDVCKVWQHGLCVGIMTEDTSPDEYFCEACRRDLHEIETARNGQRYSHYLPLRRQSRAASRSASLAKEGTRSPPKEREGRNGRNSSASQASKRRSTMNSREAGYDEAEALRRAIEASKEDAAPELGEPGSRRVKRVRSDSEEKQESAKRQRTSSRSVSPSPGKQADDSDDGAATTRNAALKSKPRGGTTTRNQRSEKPSEREERERLRVEAANKRKGRAERRRADDSDPSEELPLAARAAATTRTATTAGAPNGSDASKADMTAVSTTVEPPPQSQPTPDAPSPSVAATKTDRKRSHKKKGRNQYTRDRDGNDEDSPARSLSRDIQKDDHTPSMTRTVGEPSGKPHGKAKGGMSSKITMTDMKRKATALLDFISRTQVELAGEALPDPRIEYAKVNGSAASASASVSDKHGEDAAASDAPAPRPGEPSGPRTDKEFKELTCIEMMDTLTRKLVKWQQEYTA